MAGISSKALNGASESKKKFQGQELAHKEFNEGSGLDMYEFRWRMDDPQIGRFWQLDPRSDDYRYNSPFAFSENRVIDGRELEGLEYVSIHHYANGTIGTKLFYKSTDKEVNQRGGHTAGIYNSSSYGPLGKGVAHFYYDASGKEYNRSIEQAQTDVNSRFAFHGLYSGPGSVTKDGEPHGNNYDFSYQPLDWSDAVAKRHDMDYAQATSSGEKYANFLEDIRTVQADRDMISRAETLISQSVSFGIKLGVDGVETPYRTTRSGEMSASLQGQIIVIGALATYKQWKIDNKYSNNDRYDSIGEKFKKDHPVTATIIELIRPGKE